MKVVIGTTGTFNENIRLSSDIILQTSLLSKQPFIYNPSPEYFCVRYFGIFIKAEYDILDVFLLRWLGNFWLWSQSIIVAFVFTREIDAGRVMYMTCNCLEPKKDPAFAAV